MILQDPRILWVYLILAITFITSTNQRQVTTSVGDNTRSTNDVNFNNRFENELPIVSHVFHDIDIAKRGDQQLVDSVPYIQESIPMRIFECIRQFSILRCTKLFVLQKMEDRKYLPSTGNLTQDFLNQFFGDEGQLSSLVHGKFAHIPDAELTQRLILNFQKFFNNRDIKLHFLPGIMVKIVPSRENKLKLSFRKKEKKYVEQFTGRGAREKKKKKPASYKKAILQLAVPVMVMPIILLGSFLPFLLPVLKMATIMSVMLNNSAFIAALIYAARTHANSHVEHPISYGHP